MPNGSEKNFVRLCATLDGFRARHGHWPPRVLIPSMCLQDLRDHILTPEAFAQVCSKVDLVEDEYAFEAQDDEGHVYDYHTQGFPDVRPEPSAAEWLGVRPQPGLW